MPNIAKRFVDAARYRGDGTKRDERWDDKLAGFGLRISPQGRKSFILFYRVGGQRGAKQRLVKLGDYGQNMTVDQARKKAGRWLTAARDGKDPYKEATDAARGDPDGTVKSAVETFLALYEHEVRPATFKETRRILNTNIVSKWGGRAVRSIDDGDVARLVNGLRTAGKPYMARQVFRALTRFFRWAKANGYCDNLPFDSETSKQLVPARLYKKRDRVLDPGEIRMLWLASKKAGYPYGKLAQFILLTGQRPGTSTTAPLGECVKARWQDIDLQRRVWTIPAEAVKRNGGHEVPLSTLATRLLKSIPHADDTWVFSLTAGKHLWGFNIGKVQIGRCGGPTGWNWHDLRRSAADHMHRVLGVPRDVVDEILNHSAGQISEIYQVNRAVPEMRRALEAWARLVRLMVNERIWAKVSPILDGDNFDAADELRHAIRGDARSWNRYLQGLLRAEAPNVVALRPAAE